MNRSAVHRVAAALLVTVGVTGCAPAAVEPPSPMVEPAAPAATVRTGERPGHTEADIRFMHHMLAHHAQALAMTALVPTRTRRQDIRLLAERIEVSQRDEIAQMQRWLRDRGAEVPSVDPAHAHHAAASHAGMAGMLTPQEMARLAAATGSDFDRLFLEFMIRHHEGALTMVSELFAAPGAGQDTDIFRFASDVQADQGMEIARMRRLLSAPAP